jgi:hypothetical protein
MINIVSATIHIKTSESRFNYKKDLLDSNINEISSSQIKDENERMRRRLNEEA